MSKPKAQLAVLLFTVAMLAIFVRPVHAAGLVPCGGPTENPCTVLDAFYMIARVTNWLIMMAGVYGVFQIVLHSFWIVASAGNEEDVAKHRKGITTAVIGFFIVMAAYMFVNTTVNIILMSKCKIDFASPWTYINSNDPSKCVKNDSNTQRGITS